MHYTTQLLTFFTSMTSISCNIRFKSLVRLLLLLSLFSILENLPIAKDFGPGPACADCAGWPGSISFADTLGLFFEEYKSCRLLYPCYEPTLHLKAIRSYILQSKHVNYPLL